jgi:hypothetical protein
MHVPSGTDELPDHVDPMPMPDTRREAEMLLILLEADFYPKCTEEDKSAQRIGRVAEGNRAISSI